MPATKLLQVELDADLVRAIDIEKAKRGTSRAEVVAGLVRANLEPAPLIKTK